MKRSKSITTREMFSRFQKADKFVYVVFLLLIPLALSAQTTRVYKPCGLLQPKKNGCFIEYEVPVFYPFLNTSREEVLHLPEQPSRRAPAYTFERNIQQWLAIVLQKPERLVVEVPIGKDSSLRLYLESNELTNGAGELDIQWEGAYYFGHVLRPDGHFDGNNRLAVSFLPEQWVGLMFQANQTWVLSGIPECGYVRETNSDQTMFQPMELPEYFSFLCSSIEQQLHGKLRNPLKNDNSEAHATQSCKQVRIHFVIDHYTRSTFPSDAATVTWLTSIFNTVKFVFANSGMTLNISGVDIIQSAATDRFANCTTTNQALDSLGVYALSHPGSWNLIHLVTKKPLGGGIAYLDQLCGTNKRYLTGVSANLSNVLPTFPFPTNYSHWDTEVIAHELGHNFGSPHTHNCSWPGGAIDGCYPPEGSCTRPSVPPNFRGTIMSYCHLSVGIDLNLGFGQLPGNLMLGRVQSASCLSSISVTAQIVSPTGPVVTVCNSNQQVLKAAACTGCDYQWFMNNQPITGANASTYVATQAGTYYVRTSNGACAAQSSNLTLNIGSINVTTVASSTNLPCPGPVTLSASGANTYLWQPGNFAGPTFIPTPTQTTTYTVVGTSGNCTGSATVTVTVSSSLNLTASATPSTLCGGGVVQFAASGATSYTWRPGNFTGPNPSRNVSQTGTYTVTGTTGNCSATAQVTVTVLRLPTVRASTSASQICPENQVTLSATGATSFTWQPGNRTGANVSVSPSQTTVYTVTGDNGNCTNTATVTVNVRNVAITATASPPYLQCQTNVVLSATGSANYIWEPGSFRGSNVTRFVPATTTFTVNGTRFGCTSSATVTVTVGAPLTVTASASPSAICSPQLVQLSATGATNYRWMPGNFTGSNPTLNVNQTRTFTVTGTTGNCSASAAVTVTLQPTLVLSASASPSTLCAGNSTVLSAQGATRYTWQPGNLTGASVSVSPTSTTVYTVTGHNATNCSGSTTVTVTVNPTPEVIANVIQFANCTQPGTLVAGCVGPCNSPAGYTFRWEPGNHGPFSSGIFSVLPTQSTLYTVTITDQATGCESSFSDPVYTQMDVLPCNNCPDLVNLRLEQHTNRPNPDAANVVLNFDAVSPTLTYTHIIVEWKKRNTSSWKTSVFEVAKGEFRTPTYVSNYPLYVSTDSTISPPTMRFGVCAYASYNEYRDRSVNGPNAPLFDLYLEPASTYEWRARGVCANGDTSSWANGPDFTTPPANCTTLNLSSSNFSMSCQVRFLPNGDAVFKVPKNMKILEIRRFVVNSSPAPFQLLNDSTAIVQASPLHTPPNTSSQYVVKSLLDADDCSVPREVSSIVFAIHFSNVCPAPTDLSVEWAEINTANVRFKLNTAVTTYNKVIVEWKKVSSSTWKSMELDLNLASTSFHFRHMGGGQYNLTFESSVGDHDELISNPNGQLYDLFLEAGTTYQWRVRAICASSDTSSWVNGPNIETKPLSCFNIANNTSYPIASKVRVASDGTATVTVSSGLRLKGIDNAAQNLSYTLVNDTTMLIHRVPCNTTFFIAMWVEVLASDCNPYPQQNTVYARFIHYNCITPEFQLFYPFCSSNGFTHLFLDQSGNGYHLTPVGIDSYTFTPLGGSVLMDNPPGPAINNPNPRYLVMPPLPAVFDQGITVSAYVNFYNIANSAYDRIFDFGNGSFADNILFANAHGSLAVHCHPANNPAVYFNLWNVPPLQNEFAWYTVSITPRSIHVYINGQLVGSQTYTYDIYRNVVRNSNYIGRSNWFHHGYDSDLNGAIAQFRLWNRSLSALEIQHLFSSEREVFATPNPVCYGGVAKLSAALYPNATYWWPHNQSQRREFIEPIPNPQQYRCYIRFQSGCYNFAETFVNTYLINSSISNLANNYLYTDAPVTLTGSPSGGSFSGPGINGTTFSPQSAGVGTHTICYAGNNGCTFATCQTVVVRHSSQCNAPIIDPYTAITNIHPNGFTFHWPQAPGAVTYQLDVRNLNTQQVHTYYITASMYPSIISYPVTGLNIGTLYSCQVRSICNGPINSSWSTPIIWVQTAHSRESMGYVTFSDAANLNVYPNPSDGRFTLHFFNQTPQNLSIKLQDVRGRELLNRTITNPSGKQELSLDFSEVGIGVFILRVSGDSISYPPVRLVISH